MQCAHIVDDAAIRLGEFRIVGVNRFDLRTVVVGAQSPDFEFVKDFFAPGQFEDLSNAEKLSSVPWGGTDCSAPLRQLVATRAKGDLVILISDNESWINPGNRWSTHTLEAWRERSRSGS